MKKRINVVVCFIILLSIIGTIGCVFSQNSNDENKDTGLNADLSTQQLDYMSMTATGGNVTIGMGFCGITNDFSIDYAFDNDGTWNSFATGGCESSCQSIIIGDGETVFFKNSNESIQSLSIDEENYVSFTMEGNGQIICGGNIMSLLDQSCQSESVGDYCFINLFCDCANLINSPMLTATLLGNNCYDNMFASCRNFVNAPELPATTLSSGCYKTMFANCYRLQNAPSLPAEELANHCYDSMFRECECLINAPSLPSTSLSACCYRSMFMDCVSLVTAPSLPATVMNESCYESMFSGCTNLISSPELPATVLADRCYLQMFYCCSSLNKIPKKLPALVLEHACYASMFGHCSSISYAPELPSLSLADSCYSGMFEYCDSLNSTPTLPATSLKESCYSGMFSGCTNLTNVSTLPAKEMKKNCYWGMFMNCINLKSAPQLPANKLAEGCYESMFSGCTNLIDAPALPAHYLKKRCYNTMFCWCEKISHVETSFINWREGKYECTYWWLKGTASEGEFYCSTELDVSERGVSHIPEGWKIKYTQSDSYDINNKKDSVTITVKAKNQYSDQEVTVSDATVTLYVGAEARKIATSDDNGNVTFSLTDLSASEWAQATVSAYKLISTDKEMDGTFRDSLYNAYYPRDDSNNIIRSEYELHSETINSNGQWCGENLLSGKDLTLVLSEPRIKYNISVCYLADDVLTQSVGYRTVIRTMLNYYALNLAKATDGHVMINKIILFSTDNMMDFYDVSHEQLASRADVHIMSSEQSDKRIRANAQPDGFYYSGLSNAHTDFFIAGFDFDKNNIAMKYEFSHIQLSGTMSGDISLALEPNKYSKTLTHETGHYILGMYDEYVYWNQNQNKFVSWSEENRPQNSFGLMDRENIDIELSKSLTDYNYFENSRLHTAQSYYNGLSCEGYLAERLNSYSPYSNYSCAYMGIDRTAEYPYAGLNEFSYIEPNLNANTNDIMLTTQSVEDLSTITSVESSYFENIDEASNPIEGISYQGNDAGIALSLTVKDNTTYYAFMKKAGEENYTKYDFSQDGDTLNTNLPVTYGEIADVKVVAQTPEKLEKTTCYLEHTESTDTGYLYESVDGTVATYFTNDEPANYAIMTEQSSYQNGEYQSINPAFRFNSDQNVTVTGGEIYSVASCTADLDYTSVSWFKFNNGEWTALETDNRTEENLNVGARADLDGPGLYVLMAKPASTEKAESVTNLSYTQSKEQDGRITLCFDDPNSNSKYYHVYYSDSDFNDKTDETVAMITYTADGTKLELDLDERNKTVYAGVEVVLEDGSTSDLTKIKLTSGEADRDEDGIPDWYCDQYSLWPINGDSKNIAYSDEDGDGVLNKDEYQKGSNPLDPNDPVETLYIKVESISLDKETASILLNKTIQLIASIQPENAEHKELKWISSNESVATVDENGLVTGIGYGTAVITVSTLDGGYTATCEVTVQKYITGDVDLDGDVDIIDAQIAKEVAMKTKTLEGDALKAGDLDGNGKITINEARKILRVVLGKTSF